MAGPVSIDLLAGLEKGAIHAPDGFGPDAPKGWITLNNDLRALNDGGTGWSRKAEFPIEICALGDMTDFTKDVQATAPHASRWVCKAYYAPSTPGYEKHALFLYADRYGASQRATRQLPDVTPAKQWRVTGELRMARLPQTRHGYHMWFTVKSGDHDLCSLDLTDHSHWDGGGSTLTCKAGETSTILVEDHGVYTAEQTAKTDVFGQAFTSLMLTACAGKITLTLGEKTIDMPVKAWQHPTALEFGCRSEIDRVELGIGNLKFAAE